MLWILGAGTQWHMLRQYCPNYKTAYRGVAECGVARLLLGGNRRCGALDKELKKDTVELIAPRCSNSRLKTQDGPPLRTLRAPPDRGAVRCVDPNGSAGYWVAGSTTPETSSVSHSLASITRLLRCF